MIGVLQDVTAREEARRALHDREQRLRVATTVAALGIFEWHVLDDQSLWENERMWEIFGRRPQDGTISMREFFRTVVHPEDKVAFRRSVAAALGLSKAQAFRLVVLPQLIRVALPGLGNNWMVLLKETSLVSVITLPDIMFITTRANVVTKEPFLFFGAAMLIYLIFSLISASAIDRMERRANRGFAAFGGATR